MQTYTILFARVCVSVIFTKKSLHVAPCSYVLPHAKKSDHDVHTYIFSYLIYIKNSLIEYIYIYLN